MVEIKEEIKEVTSQPVVPEAPEIPGVPVEKPKKKWPLVVMIFLLLVAVGVGGVFAYQKLFKKTVPPVEEFQTPTPTPIDETAGWKTYANLKVGFSFKYPENWAEKGPVSENDTTIVYITADEKFGEGPEPVQYFLYVSERNNLSNLEYTKESIGEYAAYKTDKEPSRSGALTYLITRDGDKYISISLTPYDSGGQLYPARDRYVSLFNQILSTFKFLD